MSRRDCPNLIAPAFACAVFHCRSSVSVFTGAEGPSVFSQRLKSRFIPYLKFTEQLSSLPFACSAPEQKSHAAKLSFGSFAARLGTSAGSTTIAPCAFRMAIASAITRACSAFRPPRPAVTPVVGLMPSGVPAGSPVRVIRS